MHLFAASALACIVLLLRCCRRCTPYLATHLAPPASGTRCPLRTHAPPPRRPSPRPRLHCAAAAAAGASLISCITDALRLKVFAPPLAMQTESSSGGHRRVVLGGSILWGPSHEGVHCLAQRGWVPPCIIGAPREGPLRSPRRGRCASEGSLRPAPMRSARCQGRIASVLPACALPRRETRRGRDRILVCNACFRHTITPGACAGRESRARVRRSYAMLRVLPSRPAAEGDQSPRAPC